MKKRQLVSFCLGAILIFSAVGCTYASGNNTEKESGAQQTEAQTETEAQEDGSTAGATLSLDFVDYEDGIVNGIDSGVLEHTEKDGKKVLKVTPNPSTTATKISIDGYNYASAGIDLNIYRFAAIEYYYESPNPIEDNMYLGVLKSGGVFNSSFDRVATNSREKIVAGKWAYVTFDLGQLEYAVVESSSPLYARQMHMRPFQNTAPQQLTTDDVMYISRIMFFENEPELVSHTPYMNGYEDGTFKPSGTMTRAEACTVIARLLEKEENISGASSFTDISADAWYAKYIGYCEGRGLLASYSGTFLPDQAITRAEFAELVYLTGLAAVGALDVSFTDVDESHPKFSSIMASVAVGLINGYAEADGTYTFKPDNTITRAEVVTVINRATGTSKKQEQLTANTVKVFLDVDESHWAFADIAEATVPHTESSGGWVFANVDPIDALAEKVGYDVIYDFSKTNEKLAELDALEAKRIEEIRNTPNMDLSNIKGNKIYVSADGDDKNNGLSPETPVKTPARANQLVSPGGAVLFRRGDLWRGVQIEAKAGITYTAYGEGAKPVFYGSPENGADETKWSLVHEDKETGALIWMYKGQKMLDVGTLIFNEGEGFAMKEVPSSSGASFIVRGSKDTPFDYKKELDKNLEFFHAANSATTTNNAGLEIIKPGEAIGPLYLRCDNGNPGKVFDSIEFVARGARVVVGKNSNVTIDNLCIMYSAFGISASTQKNLTVTNMEIGWIGGNIQTYALYGDTTGRAVRYGNGVEVYGGCDGYFVDNCYIYQCYDAGVTHQFSASASGDCREDNIKYSNNVITDCVYSIEYFLGVNSSNPDFVREGENVLFEGNLLRRAGYGFGSFRPDANNQRHIRAGSGNNFKNFVIKNNVFDRAVEELTRTTVDPKFADAEPIYDGNVYIQGINNILFSHGADKSAKTDLTAARSIEELLGDKNAEVYFTEFIPKYTFSYAPTKTAPVTDGDRRVFEIISTVPTLSADENESTEITAPLHMELQKNKNIYREIRKSTTLEVKTDEATGIVYNEVTLVESPARIMLDCYGISPAIPAENSYLYVKILMRTNKNVKPSVNVYGMKDANGETVSGGPSGVAVTQTAGNGEWEEVIVKVTEIPELAATSAQLHINYGGNDKADSFFKNGTTDAKFDIAGWAVFSNLASAEAFDLKAAAK